MKRILDLIDGLFTAIAGVGLVLMMLVVVADIIGRNLGLWHIMSTIEQITLYMMFLGFFGLIRCIRAEGNIVVDVATSTLSRTIVRRIDGGWALLTGVVLLPLAVMSVRDGLVLDAYGQRSLVLGLSPLVHHTIAGIGLGVAALVSLAFGTRLLMARRDDAPASDDTRS